MNFICCPCADPCAGPCAVSCAGPCAGPCAVSCAVPCAGPCAVSCAGPCAGPCAGLCAGLCAGQRDPIIGAHAVQMPPKSKYNMSLITNNLRRIAYYHCRSTILPVID
ncbi:hypothetical protein EBZ80_20260 [bacterium]|nr:hypothetical protein [bacterium]